VSVKLGTSKELSVQGCVSITGLGSATGWPATVVVQYSTTAAGPWTRLGTVPLNDQQATVTCNPTLAAAPFGGTVKAKLARAYYRVYFAGQSSQGLLSSSSTPALAWKYNTQIAGLSVSARRVAKGGKLIITGRLRHDTTSWQAYARQSIIVRYRKPGATAWTRQVKVVTSASGSFRAVISDKFTATWTVIFQGNGTNFACAGRQIKVTVHS
jgi:hypothetical protein